MRTKKMMLNQPELLHALLQHLADQLSHYVSFQIQSGAQVVLYSVHFLLVTFLSSQGFYKNDLLTVALSTILDL